MRLWMVVMAVFALSGCSHIIMSDNIVSNEARRAQPPAVVAGRQALEYGTYQFCQNSTRCFVAIHDESGITINRHYLGEMDTMLYHGAFNNPLAVRLDEKVHYLQFDDSQRVWLLNKRQKPVSCNPYQSCRLNLFKQKK